MVLRHSVYMFIYWHNIHLYIFYETFSPCVRHCENGDVVAAGQLMYFPPD